MTTLVFPRAESPAVNAKGTVRPSERPRVASPITLASIRKPFFWLAFSIFESWDSTSSLSETLGGLRSASEEYEVSNWVCWGRIKLQSRFPVREAYHILDDRRVVPALEWRLDWRRASWARRPTLRWMVEGLVVLDVFLRCFARLSREVVKDLQGWMMSLRLLYDWC